ncbi:MAG: HlyD family efflux transporter periplasmic adaptor subunit [Gemmatimonadota bacterium]
MDIQRNQPKSRRPAILWTAGGVVVVLLTLGLSRLEPASPTTDRAALWVDTVRKGPMTREVRGPGTLVPEQIRWISALTPGRVEKVEAQAGQTVEVNTVLMELSNPDVMIRALEAERSLTQSQAELVSIKTSLETQRLNQEGVVATTRTDYNNALRKAAGDSALVAEGLISTTDAGLSKDRATEYITRLRIEQDRLKVITDNMQGQVKVQEDQVARLKDIVAFQQRQVDAMVVRAGAKGVLTELPLQVGQWANSGIELAKVVQPGRLKAVLRIPETEARDLSLGQPAVVDTRNGLVNGKVARMDPSSTNGTVTVDVALPDDLPKGARPDLSVDGTIEVERLGEVMHVGRPAFGQANSSVSLFKLVEDGTAAIRVKADLGRTSVNAVEILRGLQPGDVVILSDMSRYDGVDRVRLK